MSERRFAKPAPRGGRSLTRKGAAQTSSSGNVRQRAAPPGGRRLVQRGTSTTTNTRKADKQPAESGVPLRSVSNVEPRAVQKAHADAADSGVRKTHARNRLARVDQKMKDGWVAAQRHTFKAWINYQLQETGVQIQNLQTDLKDGTVLALLLQKLTGESVGRYNKNPRMKVQMVENLSLCFQCLKRNHIKTTNAGAEDFYDENIKIILGVIWTLIGRYQVAAVPVVVEPESSGDDDSVADDPFGFEFSDDSDDDAGAASSSAAAEEEARRLAEEEARRRAEAEARRKKQSQEEAMKAAKQNLLAWAKKRAEPFGIDIDNFGGSFQDGKAFMALTASIDEKFNFHQECKDNDAKHNMERSFDYNETRLNIPQLLNADHMLPPYSPDEKSVMTYISLLYQQYGGRKAIKPSEPEPEPEQDLHVEVQGEGLKAPIAFSRNTFGIMISDKNTGSVVPSVDMLQVDIIDKTTGKSLEVEKRAVASGATEFAYVATDSELEVRIEFDGEEVATLDIKPEPLLNIQLIGKDDLAPVAVGETCEVAVKVLERNGKELDVIDCIDNMLVTIRDPDGNVFHEHTGPIPGSGADDPNEPTFTVEFVPPSDGTWTIEFDYGEGKQKMKTRVRALKPQRVRVGEVAHIPLAETDVNKVIVMGPDRKQVRNRRALVELSALNKPGTMVDFKPLKQGLYTVSVVRDGDAEPQLRRLVLALDELPTTVENAAFNANSDCMVKIPWNSDWSNDMLRVQAPDGSILDSSKYSVIDSGSAGGTDWIGVRMTPGGVGDFSFMAVTEIGGGGTDISMGGSHSGVEAGGEELVWCSSIEVGNPDDGGDETPQAMALSRLTVSDGRTRSGSEGGGIRKTKAVEVVSIHPLPKKQKGVVRVHFADDPLPKLLGIQRTFKTVPVLAKTTMNDLRNQVLKMILKNSDTKTKKKVQSLCKQHQYCIVEVDRNAEETRAPFEGSVLDAVARFKRETAARLQKETAKSIGGGEKLEGADSASSSAAGSSSGNLLAPESGEKKGGSFIGGRRRKKKEETELGRVHKHRLENRMTGDEDVVQSRGAIKIAAEKKRHRTSMLLKDIDTGAWGKKAGSFKLIVRIHKGERIARANIGKLYVKGEHEDQKHNTRTIDPRVTPTTLDLSNAGSAASSSSAVFQDPEWEEQFSFSVQPSGKAKLSLSLYHDGQQQGAPPIGVVDIPIGYLSPDMAKTAWYVLKKPGQVTTMSGRRLLVTLEHHVIEIEPDTKLFFKPAPKIWLEIGVNYPKLKLQTGEETILKAIVRDEKNNFAPTHDLRGGILEVHMEGAGPDGSTLVLKSAKGPIGEFQFQFKPARPGKFKCMLRYSGTPMQRKYAIFQVKSGKKFSTNI